MWKRLLTLFVLLFLASLVSSATWIYEPVAASVTDQGALYIGKVGRNHMVKLILNAEQPEPIEDVMLDYPGKRITVSSGRIYIEFNAPSIPGRYSIKITVKKKTGIESFTIGFDVVEKPLQIKVENNLIVIPELEQNTLRILVINPLASSTYLMVTSPDAVRPIRFFLPRHEVPEPKEIQLRADFSGDYPSYVLAEDILNGETYKIPIHIHVTSTMRGRIESIRMAPDLFLPVLYPPRLLLEVLMWLKK